MLCGSWNTGVEGVAAVARNVNVSKVAGEERNGGAGELNKNRRVKEAFLAKV